MKTHWVARINYLLAWDRGMNFDNSKLVHYILINTKDTYFLGAKLVYYSKVLRDFSCMMSARLSS